MKKSITIRVLCLVVASVVLSGAVAFAAIAGSPYETLKRALLDAVTTRNVTVEGTITATLDGVLMEENKIFDVSGDDDFLSYYGDENGELTRYNYYSSGLSIYPTYTAQDGTEWYCADIRPEDESFYVRRGTFTMIDPEERNSSQMRFLELAADALIGDLKNNITMTSEDGVRLIRGTLTDSQVPELVKAGLDVLAEQSGGYSYSRSDISFNNEEYVYEETNIYRGEKTVTTYKQAVRRMTPEEAEAWEDGTFYDRDHGDFWGVSYRDDIAYVNDGRPVYVDEYTVPATRADFVNSDPLSIPMKSLAINYVHGEAEVDADGNLLSIDVGGSATITDIFGDVKEIEIKANVRFTDIGTSNPACPIAGAEQLLTAEFAKARFGSEYVSVYFKLNEDGGINADSVTTTYPGEMDVDFGGPKAIEIQPFDAPLAEVDPLIPSEAETDMEEAEEEVYND